MRRRLAAAADVFGAQGIAVGLETGQETAGELAALLGELDHPNLGVNFDPANMILYDKGDPIEAVRVLAPWIRQVHVKDAKRTKVPGTWGEEVAVGEGDVDWGGFFAAVRVLPAAVDLAIEREAGSRRVADVGAARMWRRDCSIDRYLWRRGNQCGGGGGGIMGVTHLRAYLQIPHVRIVAVCDVAKRIVNGVIGGVAGNIQQATALRLPEGARVVGQFADLLEDAAVDVVDICTPTALHPEQAIAALRAGKHVLCEKPLAQTAAEAREVARAAQGAKGFLMPAMCMRFWPGWSWLKQVVAEEAHGKVLAAGFRRVSERPAWGKGASHPGGALLDLHIHDTDFVNFLFGRPEKVFSQGVIGATGGVDHVVTQYLYRGGPAAQAEGSWLQAKGFNMSFAIQCERATLEFDLQRGAEALRVGLAGKPFRTVKLRGRDGYHGEIRYFIDCVRRGEAPAVVTARDAVTAQEICAAEEKSVRSGAVVKVG